jgi:Na+-transporting NADH:ubiquinone oxidoreductase subunit NqrB
MFLGAYAVNILGFIATSVVMTGLLLIYFGIRDWKTILSLSIGMPLFIYIFFEVFMKIPLPEGIIFVREG